MRDIFEEIFSEPQGNPMDAARRAMRSPLRSRFYREAQVEECEGGLQILLDGKPVRTPAKKPLIAPSRRLADRIAGEWAAQGDTIDPFSMPLTRLANAIIDGVATASQPVAAEVEKYLQSDLLCYRAPGPEGLLARQRRHWDPVMEWAREALGARFMLAEGVMHVRQPEEAIEAAAGAIPRGGSARELWRLGALNLVTALTGSALLALAIDAGRLTPDEAWTAAHVDEDWNMDQWGHDEMALKRRTDRRRDFDAACAALTALRE
jgi:chaperone required for assembly of F1-ATPase